MAWYDFILDWVREKLSPIWSWLYDLWDDIRDFYNRARDYAYSLYRTARDLVYDKYEDAKRYARDLLSDISLVIPQWIRDAANSIIGWWGKVTSHVGQAIIGVRTWVTEQWDNLKSLISVVEGNLTNFINSLQERFTEFWNLVKDTIQLIIPQFILDAINWINKTALSAINDFISRFPNLFNDFYYFITHPWEKVEEAAVTIIEKFIPSEEEINEKFKEELPLPV